MESAVAVKVSQKSKRKSSRIDRRKSQAFILENRWYVDKNDVEAVELKKAHVKELRKERFNVFKDNCKVVCNKSFEELFTPKGRQIVKYLLACIVHTGVVKIKAGTIAKKKACSPTTVYTCMQVVKTCNQFYIGYEGKGTYVIVDKLHKNYLQAMKEIFDMNMEKAEALRKDLVIGNVDKYGISKDSPLHQLLKTLSENELTEYYLHEPEIERLEEIVSMEQGEGRSALEQLYYEGLVTEIANENWDRVYSMLNIHKGQKHHLLPLIEYALETLEGITNLFTLDALYLFLSYINRRRLNNTDTFIFGMCLQEAKEHFEKIGVGHKKVFLDKLKAELETEYSTVIALKTESGEEHNVALDNDTMLSKQRPQQTINLNAVGNYTLSEYLSNRKIKAIDRVLEQYEMGENAGISLFFSKEVFLQAHGNKMIKRGREPLGYPF